MFKKILAFIISLSFILTSAGCGKSDPDANSAVTECGRYIEEEISIKDQPSGAGELFCINNNTAFIDEDSLKLYTKEETGESFSASELPSLKELGDDGICITSIACSHDGAYILSYLDLGENSTDQEKTFYAYIMPDGTIKKLDFDLQWTTLESFDFSDDGKIYACSYEGNVYEINTEDQSAKKLFNTDKEPVSFDVVSDYIIVSDSRQMYFYDTNKGQLIETPEVLKNFYKEQKFDFSGATADDPVCDFCKGADNSIFIITKKGLYRYVFDGNQVEQLLDGMSYHIGSPAYSIRSVIAESDNSFLVSYSEGNVMRYRFDASASNQVTSSLKIYSLKQNDTLDQVISEYKINHPDVDVKYETGMEKDSGVTYEDAIKNLNTEMCSDEVPDILMLDGMDTENYIEKNILLDLKSYQDKIDPDDSLLDNIAEHYENDGLYTMPCKFQIPVIVANKDSLAKINSFSDLAQMIEDKHKTITDSSVAGFVTEDEVLDAGLEFYSGRLITDKGLDTEMLRQMLEDCCKIYKSEHAAMDEGYAADYKQSKEFYSSGIDKWGYEAGGLSMRLLNNNEKLACGTADGFVASINIITSLGDQDPEIQYRYGTGDADNVFIPVCSLGVCSSGKNKDQAIDFLETAFSDSVQNIELYDGLPVNQNSLEYFYSKNKNDTGHNFGSGDPQSSESLFVKAKYMDESEINIFKNALQKLDTPVYIDTMTKDVIINAGTKCLDSNTTPDDAVKEINEKLSLKMQE